MKVPALPRCPKEDCGEEIPVIATLCGVCGGAVGYPNVRYAERPEEVFALDQRYKNARISAIAKGSLAALDEFQVAVDNSWAVISKKLADLWAVMNSDSKFILSYYPSVRAGQRIPQNNQWDEGRTPNDSRISPNFHEELHFAALSIDGRGIKHYGGFAISLRENLIHYRSSVFEENPVIFNEKYPIGRERPVPFGFRSSWGARSRLAVAKLQSKIGPDVAESEFPQILMERPEVNTGESDFMEVHVYGQLHARTFEHVIGNAPENPLDALMCEEVRAKLEALGTTWSEDHR